MGKLSVCLDCHVLTEGTRCPAHQQARQQQVASFRRWDMDKRYGTRQWKAYSTSYRSQHPDCAIKAEGCTLVTDVVDHILPVRTHPHLFWEASNHRPACQTCNQWAARRGQMADAAADMAR